MLDTATGHAGAASAFLVVGDCRRGAEVASIVAGLDYRCVVETAESALRATGLARAPDLVIVATDDGNAAQALACLRCLRSAWDGARYLFVASESSEALAIAAFHAGAERYLREPWTADALVSELRMLTPGDAECACTEALVGSDRFVGRSNAVRQLKRQLARIAPTNSTVLITGESGTGKEVVAELIHANGQRADKQLVCLNTAAMPESLVESELFGHERGAFTGADRASEGKLSAANGGTVFLDEIGDVPLAVQAKLLRAIENREIHRVGASRSSTLDVRIIAATHQDLEQAIQEGRFRQDLYYRLNVLRVWIPPLRERPDDIPVLVQHYIRRFNRDLPRTIRGLSPRTMEALCAYHWPGNVRELRNVVEAVMVNTAPSATGIVDVMPEVMRRLAFAVGAPKSERERLLQVLRETNWNKSKAAAQLCCSRMTLYRKMHQHDVGLRQ
ncbi:Transcriptional regulatory protein [Lysobacter dokdonensis DS-58]|uniref:Transcriptional regulatory protein n=1 Tax=Lysobacter dokdonensis DS-58 TaxID=1300345 RepID=A0A0A2WKV8_9GAMM|nr:sigma-54 dependent transcriptional regulator [Lysobacter dokdonensis]KGQ19362.1 Transcriptional regulatory protein [Lysobacter dokdonensis DS-58]